MPVILESSVVSPTTVVDLKMAPLISGAHYNQGGGAALGGLIDKRSIDPQT
jgi:hypothetical protein